MIALLALAPMLQAAAAECPELLTEVTCGAEACIDVPIANFEVNPNITKGSLSPRNFNLEVVHPQAVAIRFEFEGQAVFDLRGRHSEELVFSDVSAGSVFEACGTDLLHPHTHPIDASVPATELTPVRVYEVIPESAYRHQNWMADHADEIGNQLLSETTFPSTHDAGTYSLSSDDVYAASECGLPLTFDPVYPASVNQNRSFAQQLHEGVRSFDLRFQNVDGGLRVFHGASCMYGETLDETVAQFHEFLASHPGEIAIMQFKKMQELGLGKGVAPLGLDEHRGALDLLCDTFDTPEPVGDPSAESSVCAAARGNRDVCILSGELQAEDGSMFAAMRLDEMWAHLEQRGCSSGVIVSYTTGSDYFWPGDLKVIKDEYPWFWDGCVQGGSGCDTGDGKASTVETKIRRYLDKAVRQDTLSGVGLAPKGDGEKNLSQVAPPRNIKAIEALMSDEFVAEEFNGIGSDFIQQGAVTIDDQDVTLIDHAISRNLTERIEVRDVDGLLVEGFALEGGERYTWQEANALCIDRGLQLATKSEAAALHSASLRATEGWLRCESAWTAPDSDDGSTWMYVPAPLWSTCSSQTRSTARLDQLASGLCVRTTSGE